MLDGVIFISANTKIKQVLLEKSMTVTQLAEKMGITQQALSQKLYRNKFSYTEYEQIADLLNCDVVTVMRDTKKAF